MSILRSCIMFFRISGLLYWSVVEETERVLNVAKLTDGGMSRTGPGLTSMSPDRRIRQEIKIHNLLPFIRNLRGRGDLVRSRRKSGRRFRDGQTEGSGIGENKKRRSKLTGGGWEKQCGHAIGKERYRKKNAIDNT